MNRFFTALWNIDPGYIHLRRASKTIFAILVTMAITSHFSGNIILVACIGSGISMQGIAAITFLGRIRQLVIFDLCYILSFAIGLLVKHSSFFTSLALIIIGFAVNYIRRFNLQKSNAPMMIWLLCFMATIIPFPNTVSHWDILLSLLIGISVSAFTYIFIFPEHYSKLFILNANRIFDGMATGFYDLRKQLISHPQDCRFEDTNAAQQRVLLTELLHSNQMITDNLITARRNPAMSRALIQLYGVVNAFKVILKAYHRMWGTEKKIPRILLAKLCIINMKYAEVCQSVTMQEDFSITIERSLVSLRDWPGQMDRFSTEDADIFMLLLNIKLGLTLMNKHLTKLLWQKNET